MCVYVLSVGFVSGPESCRTGASSCAARPSARLHPLPSDGSAGKTGEGKNTFRPYARLEPVLACRLSFFMASKLYCWCVSLLRRLTPSVIEALTEAQKKVRKCGISPHENRHHMPRQARDKQTQEKLPLKTFFNLKHSPCIYMLT